MSTRTRVLHGVLTCCLGLLASAALFGQATGSISGTVTDASGAAAAGVSLTITGDATGSKRETTTDNAGHYVVPLLGAANYTVKADLKGFQPAEQRDIRLQVDEHREIDFKLSPASVSSTVEVQAAAVEVQTTNPTLGQVITSQQVAELPLNGRDFVQLATLTPGTTAETNPGSFFNGGPSSEVSARGSFSLSVGGSRANSTDWLLDGNDNNELTGGGIAILPSIDAIQEFKVLTYNYSAEWGTRAGPTVLVTTKSGTNALHGTLFEFFRNTKLDARSFFAANTEQFNLNQFGGSVGGPIKKDKTFFFADIQNKFQRHGIPFTGLVPSVAMRNGDFTDDAFGNLRKGFLINPNVTGAADTAFQCTSAGTPIPANANGSQAKGVDCNKIPANLLNPIGQKLLSLYPMPNANNVAGGYNYVSEPARKLNEGEFDGRLDHNFSNNDYMFARFSYDQATSYVPGGSPGFAEANPFASNQGILNHGRNIALSETHVFSGNTVNQLSAGYNRIFNYISSQGTGSCLSKSLGIPGANLGGDSCGLTSTQLDEYWSLGDRGFSPFQGGTNVFSVSDSLDMVRGNHDIKVGMGIRANQMNIKTQGFGDGYWIYTGAWGGDPIADLALGLPSLAIHDQAFGGDTTGRRWKLFRPYVEDNWRVTKDLTLNLGIAWAIVTPITEAANRQANFNPATGQFAIAGKGGNAGPAVGIQLDKTAFEPRIGVAWKPFGSTKTAVRGGYAIFHDSSWNQGSQGLWQNPPYYAESDQFAFQGGCTFSTAACATVYGQTPGALSASSGFPIFTSEPVPANFTGTILSQNTNFKQGRVQQFNFNVERQLPGEVLLTMGYAGSRSSHILIDGNNLNVSSPSACGKTSGYTLGCGANGAAFGVPYTAFPFSTIENITDQGRAHYNSLQIKAETKKSNGIYAIIGYTYSRAYDNGFSDGLGSSIGATYYPLPNWENLDWGLSQINNNHNFTASLIYELPFGKGKKFGSSWNGAVNQALGGWEVTVIEKATSGFPIYIVDSSNNSGVNFENNGNSLNRPNQTCANPQSGSQSIAAWFNTSCFSAPAAGQLGNASRSPASGPNFINTDLSVIKHFPVKETLRLDFRAEFFNLFNHAQFGEPGSDLNSPTSFGIISSTVNNPRVIQFAIKAAF